MDKDELARLLAQADDAIAVAPPPHTLTEWTSPATAPGGSVLLIQTSAGGMGLNIQAANVLIIAEPQVLPSVEAQGSPACTAWAGLRGPGAPAHRLRHRGGTHTGDPRAEAAVTRLLRPPE